MACGRGVVLADALCSGCGHFVISDLSPLQQGQRTAARGPGGMVAMIAIAVIGVVLASGIVLAYIESHQSQKQRRFSQAQFDGLSVLPIVEKYQVDHAGQCPTMKRLHDEKEISATSKTTDPWDHPYRIECKTRDGEPYVTVSSDGPDGRRGTADDIRVSTAGAEP